MNQPARSHKPSSYFRATPVRAPRLSAAGITWRSTPTEVVICLELENPSARRTDQGELVVESAELGAYVATQPLARIPVPALDPGGRRRLELRVSRLKLPDPNALGRRILERLDAFKGPLEIELLSHLDWAGNLNVWFHMAPGAAVEVHRALDLRICTGRTAGIGLFLPNNSANYQISLHGSSGLWPARIFRFGGRMCLLAVKPRVTSSKAKIAVHVTRHSDGRMVPVEFSFESVTDPTETLGCVTVRD